MSETPKETEDQIKKKAGDALKMKKVEETFLTILKTNNIKYKSKKYYEFQYIFFNGAIAILEEVPPKWGIALMSNREIIEKY